MGLFWTIFFAVIAAQCVSGRADDFQSARKRNRDYCHKEALRYSWMAKIKRARGHDSKQDDEQARYWEKQSKSRIPIHPTQSEEDTFFAQSQEDGIRQLIVDFNSQHSNGGDGSRVE